MLRELIIALFVHRILSVAINQKQAHKISVNLEKLLHTVSDQFLSVTIDSGAITHNWNNLDLKSMRVLNMGKALAPAMLRIGGTAEDFVIFKSPSESSTWYNSKELSSTDVRKERSNITLLASQWDAINQFTKEVGWEMVFGLNVFLRSPWPNGSWDTANAEELIRYTISKGYNVNWELGNEPDLFPKVTNTTVVEVEQLVKDFEALKRLLAKLNLNPKYVAGPDVATLTRNDYFESFLKILEKGVINAVTWHHYYTNGSATTLPDFISIKLLDHFIEEAKAASEMVEKYQQGAELWLGETSSCFGGGAPDLSDTYVAGFMWLDKLGLAAVVNHTVVLRQDFVGGSYALLDSSANPLPDFWLSALYKKLVGTKVLYVDGSTDSGRNIRIYAHCAKSPLYLDGDVVLIMLNLNNVRVSVELADHELTSSARDVYWLTPSGGTNDLQSKKVTLNGKLLELRDGVNLPDLTPMHQDASHMLELPALSFGYYVFKNAKAKACMNISL